jgi:thiol-disulfide isomerase/thioredoxin
MNKKIRNALFLLSGVAIIAGLLLTLLSLWSVCTEACIESHKYRIFGMPFEIFGLVYFSLLILTYAFTKNSSLMAWATGLLLAAGFGAEVMFILIQKYTMGGWCPLCLSIAFTIAIGTLSYALALTPSKITLKQLLPPISLLFIGFFAAYFGVAKNEESVAAGNFLKESLAFGNKKSPIEVYAYTSWVCPACKRFEPNLERIVPRISDKAKIVFVDNGDDLKTLNFLPYNVSFLKNNKDIYLELRHELKNLADDTDTPTDEEVQKAISTYGIKYHQLHNSEIALAAQYFKELSKKHQINILPAFVIIDTSNGKQKTLTGIDITALHVLEAISSLQDEKGGK